MVRHYKKLSFWSQFSKQKIAFGLASAIFVLYIGFVIITPKSQTIQTLDVNGVEFRLCETFYTSEPLIEIDAKRGFFRRTLFIESGDLDLFKKELELKQNGNIITLSADGVEIWQYALDK